MSHPCSNRSVTTSTSSGPNSADGAGEAEDPPRVAGGTGTSPSPASPAHPAATSAARTSSSVERVNLDATALDAADLDTVSVVAGAAPLIVTPAA